MEPTSSARPRTAGTPSGAHRPLVRATVAPVVPLALLECMRVHDRPREVLEDEDLSASLPRRLGLTGVVESQIQRYEDARRRGQPVSAEEVASLLRLVLRRPDAEAILQEAGRDVARGSLRGGGAPAALRVLPRAMIAAAARRATRRVLRRILGRGRLDISGRPAVVRIADALTAEADATGVACTLYAAVIEEVVHLYTRRRPSVRHTRCASRGDAFCEWTVLESLDEPSAAAS